MARGTNVQSRGWYHSAIQAPICTAILSLAKFKLMHQFGQNRVLQYWSQSMAFDSVASEVRRPDAGPKSSILHRIAGPPYDNHSPIILPMKDTTTTTTEIPKVYVYYLSNLILHYKQLETFPSLLVLMFIFSIPTVNKKELLLHHKLSNSS